MAFTDAQSRQLRAKLDAQHVKTRNDCGRTPSHAHHVRFAQSRGLGLKVSDEFTVPLCAIHHNQNHQTGNEKQWWEDRKLDPLAVAQKLWQLHLNGSQTPVEQNDEVCGTKKTNAPLSE